MSELLSEPGVVGDLLGTLDFTTIYREWFVTVLGWLRAFGTLDSELEDVAQETFVVVCRKLSGFDGRNLPGWLWKIAAQTASDHRRRAWVRRLFQRAPSTALDLVPSDGQDPQRFCELSQAQRELRRRLSRLKEPHRVAFWLFEIEGYRAGEIAALLGVSEATVTMRIHYARKQLHRALSQGRKEPA
jgi:RNA polymerase sigma-70 factor (ECF subfamily)